MIHYYAVIIWELMLLFGALGRFNYLPQIGYSQFSRHLVVTTCRPISSTVPNPAPSLDKYLAENCPKAHKYYKFVADGSKWCLSDLKHFVRINHSLRTGKMRESDLSVEELLICIQCPIELARLVTILLLLQIPGVGEAIILIGILRPRLVLTRHFWTPTLTQVDQTTQMRRNERYLFPQIIEELKQQSTIPGQFQKLPLTFGQLYKLKVPSLDHASLSHRIRLKRLHKVPILSLSNVPLLKRAKLLQLLDLKLAANQTLIAKMNASELQLHLYLRKLNYELVDVESMRLLLTQWVQSTNALSPTVYLYAPVLFQAKPSEFYYGKGATTEFDQIQKTLSDFVKHLPKRTENLRKKFGSK